MNADGSCAGGYMQCVLVCDLTMHSMCGHVGSSAAPLLVLDDMLRCCKCLWVMLAVVQHLCLCLMTC